MKTLLILSLLFSFSLGAKTPVFHQDHVKELMGKRATKFQKSYKSMKGDLFKVVKNSLPSKYKAQAPEIAQTILNESRKYELDPMFVVALIMGESSFNPESKGPVGEIGLMQLRLSTGEWLCSLLNVKWEKKKTLRDPIYNIKLGTYYISRLRKNFNNESQLYIAAYNMGEKGVRKAVYKKIKPKDYPIHVMKYYISLATK